MITVTVPRYEAGPAGIHPGTQRRELGSANQDGALPGAQVAAHVIIGVSGGQFISMTDRARPVR